MRWPSAAARLQSILQLCSCEINLRRMYRVWQTNSQLAHGAQTSAIGLWAQGERAWRQAAITVERCSQCAFVQYLILFLVELFALRAEAPAASVALGEWSEGKVTDGEVSDDGGGDH